MPTRKLMSRRRTLLGTVTYPDLWDAILLRDGGVRFAVEPPLTVDYLAGGEACAAVVPVATLTLWLGHGDRDAVMLQGISLERFEQIRGCSFAPGAAYIRSLLDEG